MVPYGDLGPKSKNKETCQSVVMNDWVFRLSLCNSNCKYPWDRSNEV